MNTSKSNSFSPLEELSEEPTPIATSSPHRLRRGKATSKPLKIAIINFQSLTNKRAALENFITSLVPDVILGTESHLDANHHSAEYFPTNYVPNRKDRNTHGGGVFTAIRDTITASAIKDETQCESVWNELQTQNQQSVLIGSFYRPPNSREDTLIELEKSLTNMRSLHPNAQIILGGDFNLPGIDWDLGAPKVRDPHRTKSELLLETMSTFDLEQVNKSPTRGENILDLCFTTNPGLVHKCYTAPGISDHDILVIECSTKAKINKKPPRRVFCYNRADWNKVKEDLLAYQQEYLSSNPSSRSVEQNWNDFKANTQSIIEQHIPTKLVGSRYHLPYITTEIKRLIRRKARLYNKARHSKRERDWTAFKNMTKNSTP
jgi:hypothetical protein